MLIIGRQSLDYDALVTAVLRTHPESRGRFLTHMLSPLWEAALHHGIDPVGMVAQSGHETGWGTYGGAAHPAFNNTCGLKASELVRQAFPGEAGGDLPLAHAQFATLDVGARAHAQHLLAYCGVPVYYDLLVDPRYHLVGPPRCVHWRDLNGRWAGRAGTTYGSRIEQIADELIVAGGTAG